MQNVSPFNFASDDDVEGFEDVERLFSKLEKFTPPADMVARIMGAVVNLPSPQELQKMQDSAPTYAQEGLIVLHNGKEPS
ncbi:hypothetical protein KDW_59900 [Dictyobacter vulcani]|uniref:Uncharacterized protein n=1 Tax=Dictyobacter vulcani TaxID=2607529 RepID=A0A5J4KQ53_9CHLR|nr:hypothetical protein [Dictyobacter vulcani]GER91828.1 hypothetical protein KDW_59900 [Dictyobacter vulcani]